MDRLEQQGSNAMLESRCSMVEAEAEGLGQQNDELLGLNTELHQHNLAQGQQIDTVRLHFQGAC